MNLALFIALLFVLQIFCFFIGNKVSKKMKDEKDYYLAGRTIKFFPLLMTFIATQIGGGLILGAAEEAYKFGFSVLLYPLGASLGMLLLAMGVGKKLSQFGVSTVAEIFEVVYKSPVLKKIASILSMVSLFMIFVAQILASKKFMASLGIENEWIFIGFWAIVIAYTVLGGLKAVIATDVVQALFFIAVFVMAFGLIYFSVNSLTIDFSLSSIEKLGSSKWCGWLFMPLLFMVIEQDMGQRCFAAKNPKRVSLAALIAALVTMAICTIPVVLGTMAKTINLPIAEGASVFMTAINALTNPFVAALVGCAILAAIISTADSLINAISSHLFQDFKFSFLRSQNGVRIAQLFTMFIAIAGLALSYCFNNVVDLLIQSYELSVYCLFIPLFFALFKIRASIWSAGGAMVFGALAFVLFRIYPLGYPKEIVSVIVSLIGYGLGYYYSRLRLKSPFSGLRIRERL